MRVLLSFCLRHNGGMKRELDLSRKYAAELLERQDHICPICGQPILECHAVAVDHWIAHGLGGANSLENYRATHALCNDVKWKHPLSELPRIRARCLEYPPEAFIANPGKCVDCGVQLIGVYEATLRCESCKLEARRAKGRRSMAKRLEDPEYREENRQRVAAWREIEGNQERHAANCARRHKERYATDKEYKERVLRQSNEWHANNPERTKELNQKWYEKNAEKAKANSNKVYQWRVTRRKLCQDKGLHTQVNLKEFSIKKHWATAVAQYPELQEQFLVAHPEARA